MENPTEGAAFGGLGHASKQGHHQGRFSERGDESNPGHCGQVPKSVKSIIYKIVMIYLNY